MVARLLLSVVEVRRGPEVALPLIIGQLYQVLRSKGESSTLASRQRMVKQAGQRVESVAKEANRRSVLLLCGHSLLSGDAARSALLGWDMTTGGASKLGDCVWVQGCGLLPFEVPFHSATHDAVGVRLSLPAVRCEVTAGVGLDGVCGSSNL